MNYYLNHKEEISKKRHEYYIKNRDRILISTKIYQNKIKQFNKLYNETHEFKYKNRSKISTDELRLRVLYHYSNGSLNCICCKENNIDFLTIDHINGGGCKHRKKIGTGRLMYIWLINNGFPNGYQIMCMNCNWGRRKTGICPHKSQLLNI